LDTTQDDTNGCTRVAACGSNCMLIVKRSFVLTAVLMLPHECLIAKTRTGEAAHTICGFVSSRSLWYNPMNSWSMGTRACPYLVRDAHLTAMLSSGLQSSNSKRHGGFPPRHEPTSTHKPLSLINRLKAILNARHYRRAVSQSFVSLHSFLFAAEIAFPLFFTPS